MTRSRWLILLGLVGVQAVLAWSMFTPSPHNGGDNAGYVALGNALATGAGYVETWEPGSPQHTKYPPVLPLLIALAIQLGATTWSALKIIPLASSLVTVGATFLWASRRLGDVAGAGVALLTGFSWALLVHSGWVLSDVPFLAFTLFSVWAIESAISRESEHPPLRWVVVACASALAAYFTRSAGLPLVLAILGSLAVRREWRMVATFTAAVGLPAAIWFVRGVQAGSDEGRYVSEFFLVNPYDPGLGSAGIGDMAARIGGNALQYPLVHLPRAWVGDATILVVVVTLLLLGLAMVGWLQSLLEKRGPAELFLPLYTGLILVWPTVWSSERFALPLIPLLLVYAAEGARNLLPADRPRVRHAVLALAFALLWVPQARSWWAERDVVRACNEASEEFGPWACAGRPTLAFATIAAWSGTVLDRDEVVLSRKPRIFHLLSGLPSRTYPFEDDPDALLAQADALGARWLVFDGIGSAALRYVGPALVAHPDRFCQVVGVGRVGSPDQTEFLRILTVEEARRREAGRDEPRTSIGICAEELVPAGREIDPLSTDRIPLLVGAGRVSPRATR